MNDPIDIARYIALKTDEPIDKSEIKNWLLCVRGNAPSGLPQTIQLVDDNGEPRSVKLVHRETKEGHFYLVPLTRDLNDNEVEKIVTAYAKMNPDMDFDIETNARFMAEFQKDAITMDQAKHLELCKALAKHKHEDWMRERADAGWRYGVKYDADEKVHPMLRPWDQLPERYKMPDMELPQRLVNLLDQQGYSVISKEDLSKLLGG